MSLLQFFRLLNRNLNLFLLCALTLAVVTYMLTRNLPKSYETEMEIFTGIASGVNIEAVDNTKVDYFTTSTEYDNLINIIKSRQTLEEVGMRLLVQHMMLDSADPAYITKANYGHFRYKISDSLEKILLDPYSVENTLRRIRNYRRINFNDNRVKLTFENGNSPYSYQRIANISVRRIQSSDLIKLNFSSDDPGITQSTLLILTEVFTNNVASIKTGQSRDVVGYFKQQVDQAAEILNTAEGNLQDFRIKYRIINYEEQTRNLTIEKEKMEDEYQKELAKQRAGEAVIRKLEKQLSLNNIMITLGNAILEKKKELIVLRSQIAEMQTYLNDPDLLDQLRAKASRLEEEVRNQLMQRYEYSRTTDGIDVSTIIGEWLRYTLELDETNARVAVFLDRRKYFEEQYDIYAPLGSQFGRLGRDIGIKESNYLELLNSLNQALLRQKSEMVSSGGLVVTSPPPYPHTPKPSKAMLLVVVAGVIGFIVPFLFIIVKELLDSSIRTPERGEEQTGLKLMGAYPDLTTRSEVKNIDFEWLHNKSAALITQNLRLESRKLSNPKLGQVCKNLLVFSTRPGDGKLLNTHVIANELVSLNFRVLVLGFKDLPEGETPYYDYLKYDSDKRFINSEHLSELVPIGYDPNLFDYCFMILQPILVNPFPINLLEQFSAGLCVTGAFRNWSRADKTALHDFMETLKFKPGLMLNGVEPDYMVSVLGEIEKERSMLRVFLKRLLSMQLRGAKPKLLKKRVSKKKDKEEDFII
jgi:succinoglycan biosynthesis transport protein ExoP